MNSKNRIAIIGPFHEKDWCKGPRDYQKGQRYQNPCPLNLQADTNFSIQVEELSGGSRKILTSLLSDNGKHELSLKKKHVFRLSKDTELTWGVINGA